VTVPLAIKGAKALNTSSRLDAAAIAFDCSILKPPRPPADLPKRQISFQSVISERASIAGAAAELLKNPATASGS
jgi:hypothetical protein